MHKTGASLGLSSTCAVDQYGALVNNPLTKE